MLSLLWDMDTEGKVHGVGIKDDKSIPSTSKEYYDWKDMLKRCYSDVYKEKHPKYKDATVDKIWHKLGTFAKWRKEHYKQGYVLDKDLLILGNKVYSPWTCLYVPVQTNLLITTGKGVSYNKKSKKWSSQISIDGKKVHIGYHKTEAGARAAYLNKKSSRILSYVKSNTDMPEKVKTALKKRASQFRKGEVAA